MDNLRISCLSSHLYNYSFPTPDDFVLFSTDPDAYNGGSSVGLSFPSTSIVGDMQCAQFDPIQDTVVEDDEVFNFFTSTRSGLDVIVSDSNMFTLTLRDDDGVEFGLLETTNIREESTMERQLCIELLNIFGGLERSVVISVSPRLEGYSTMS